MNANSIRVLSIDDHPMVREGIATIIKGQADMSMAGTASNGNEWIEAFRALQPDVTLMDLRLPDLSGVSATIAIRSEFPEAQIIVLTTVEGDVDLQRMLKAGARGCLLKSMPPCYFVAVAEEGSLTNAAEARKRIGRHYLCCHGNAFALADLPKVLAQRPARRKPKTETEAVIAPFLVSRSFSYGGQYDSRHEECHWRSALLSGASIGTKL
jgi:DNA-binding NarL/FixJ family response regulator